eukprot:6213137-Pleurochrysis_carterae.AAC.1
MQPVGWCCCSQSLAKDVDAMCVCIACYSLVTTSRHVSRRARDSVSFTWWSVSSGCDNIE